MAPPYHPYFASTFADHLANGTPLVEQRNIIELIDDLAEKVPERSALGYAMPPKDPKISRLPNNVITFGQLSRASKVAAGIFERELFGPEDLGQELDADVTVGLLLNSSIEFVVYWLALARLGLSVLLIS